jgi:hypothetical protein
MDTNKITVIAGLVALVVGILLYAIVMTYSPQLSPVFILITDGASIILMLVGMVAILRLFW